MPSTAKSPVKSNDLGGLMILKNNNFMIYFFKIKQNKIALKKTVRRKESHRLFINKYFSEKCIPKFMILFWSVRIERNCSKAKYKLTSIITEKFKIDVTFGIKDTPFHSFSTLKNSDGKTFS